MVDLSNLDDDVFDLDVSANDDAETAKQGSWLILIVDDDSSVYEATRLALNGKQFEGKKLEFLQACSAAEAKKVVCARDDIALILLDVVMETDTAGLDFAQWFRNEHNQQLTRIILRTGQPGQAPEEEIINNYEIDDYRAKTELTTTRLYTSVISALRSYRSLTALDSVRCGLERVIESSANLLDFNALTDFSSGVLKQISAILGSNDEHLMFARIDGQVKLIASSSKLSDEQKADLSGEILTAVKESFETREKVVSQGASTIFINGKQRHPFVVYVNTEAALDPLMYSMLELFCQRIASGFETAEILTRLRAAHQSSVSVMANLAEYKDDDTGDHVLRLAMYSRAVADACRQHPDFNDEITDEYIHSLGYGAILHDVGKISIPDQILKKPGKLDPNEWEVMKSHTVAGGRILERNMPATQDNEYLRLGAQIAYNHHEKWDGSGYPEGKRGNAIPLAARITAIVDVYDALIHERCYKEAWPEDKALQLIKDNAGKEFDPLLVDVFMDVIKRPAEELERFAIKF